MIQGLDSLVESKVIKGYVICGGHSVQNVLKLFLEQTLIIKIIKQFDILNNFLSKPKQQQRLIEVQQKKQVKIPLTTEKFSKTRFYIEYQYYI